MRILIGTVEIAGMIPDFADGFRRLGHEVTTVVRHLSPWHLDIQYDVDLRRAGINWPDAVARSKSSPVRLVRGSVNRSAHIARMLRLIATHDVFIFQWGSLFRDHRDYPLLKRLGKKIVSVFVGSDIRHWSAFHQQFKVELNKIDESYANDPLARPLRNLRMGELYSDLILSQPNQSSLALRPYHHNFVPLDLTPFKCEIPARDVPVVVHAPSKRSIKGTKLILAALDRLSLDGIRFELRFLEGASNSTVVDALAHADLAVDQLYLWMHGRFGVEAMASGCALASCNREDFEPFPSKRPIWNVEPDNVYQQLKRLLTDKELRIRLAREGRAYVERYQDTATVAKRIVEALNGECETHDHYPSFFARDYRLPEGETIPDDLQKMTAQIVQRWGLPEGVEAQRLIDRGLMSADGLDRHVPVRHWTPASVPAEQAVI